MEFFSIISAGAGSFVIIPTAMIAGGALVVGLLAIIEAFVNGSADKIYAFANEYTCIVILVIVIISIVISLLICRVVGKKYLEIPFLFGLSLTLTLSLLYSEIIYWVGGFAESLEEVFIIALLLIPVFFLFLFIQASITFVIGVATFFIPMCLFGDDFERNDKTIHIVSSVVGGIINIGLILFFCFSDIPTYIIQSLQ